MATVSRPGIYWFTLQLQAGVYVIKQIVDVLHRDLEILETQLKWKLRASIEAFVFRSIASRWHGYKDISPTQS